MRIFCEKLTFQTVVILGGGVGKVPEDRRGLGEHRQNKKPMKTIKAEVSYNNHYEAGLKFTKLLGQIHKNFLSLWALKS